MNQFAPFVMSDGELKSSEFNGRIGEIVSHALEPDESGKPGNIGSNECYRFYTSSCQNKRIFHINELINSTFGPDVECPLMRSFAPYRQSHRPLHLPRFLQRVQDSGQQHRQYAPRGRFGHLCDECLHAVQLARQFPPYFWMYTNRAFLSISRASVRMSVPGAANHLAEPVHGGT